MKNLFKHSLLCVLAVCASAMAQSHIVTIDRVTVSGDTDAVVIAIDSSQPVTPQAQLLSGPDRIVLDFPGAVPGRQLRDIPLRGALRSVRVGLFSAKPPVTRVVLDLKIPQKYQISTIGNRVLVKVNLAQQAPTQTDEMEPKQ